LRGADLRQLLRQTGPLPLQQVLNIVLDVCRGLSASHANGLVHRDLKPENVFVVMRDDGSQCAKILDFGVVQLRDENSNSRPGSLVGTVKYMAPEQVLAKGGVDARADIHALGVIVYECLSGQVPFGGASTEEVLFRILNGPIKPLGELTSDLPKGFEEIVMRALARSADDRYSTIADFAQSLLHFRRESAVPDASVAPFVFTGSRSSEDGTMTGDDGSPAAEEGLNGNTRPVRARTGSVARRIALAAAVSIAAWLVIWQVQAQWPAARANALPVSAATAIGKIRSTTIASESVRKLFAGASANGGAVIPAPKAPRSTGLHGRASPGSQRPHGEPRPRQATRLTSSKMPSVPNVETPKSVSPRSYPAAVFDENNPYERPQP